jgi:hypothetical protein
MPYITMRNEVSLPLYRPLPTNSHQKKSSRRSHLLDNRSPKRLDNDLYCCRPLLGSVTRPISISVKLAEECPKKGHETRTFIDLICNIEALYSIVGLLRDIGHIGTQKNHQWLYFFSSLMNCSNLVNSLVVIPPLNCTKFFVQGEFFNGAFFFPYLIQIIINHYRLCH